MIRSLVVGLCLLPAASLAIGAQESRIPARPTGLVSDFANVIPDATEAQMTRLIEIVRAGSQGEIAVVTLPDIGGREALDVALEIGRAWGVGARADIGDRARNAGVVVLLVPKETSSDGSGQIAISVGQGAEGFITDGNAGDMRREATPLLAEGNYGDGLALITARLAQRYSAEFDFALDSTLVPQRRRGREGGFPPVLYIVIIMFVLSMISGGGGGGRGGRGRRGGVVVLPFPMGGGFGGGGFGGGGFGGGGFGGFGGGGGFSGGGSGGRF